MEPFGYQKAFSAAAAVEAFRNADDALYIAGGQTIIPVMKQGLAAPTDVIDLAGASDLAGVTVANGVVSIGAMTRHADVAGAQEVQEAIPALAALAGAIGDPHVRNRGAIGGSLANNDPSADYPAAVLGLDATVVTNARKIAADDYFAGLFETSLDEGELILRVEFPVPEKAGYAKFPNPASRYALVGVMAAKTGDGVRVAVTGAGQEGVFRVPEMEAALNESFAPGSVAGLAVNAGDLIADMHADGAYRSHLISVMTKRAVQAALGWGEQR